MARTHASGHTEKKQYLLLLRQEQKPFCLKNNSANIFLAKMKFRTTILPMAVS